MSSNDDGFDAVSGLAGAGLYLPCVSLGGLAGAVLYGLVGGLAEEVGSFRAAAWISLGVGGFFAGALAGYIGGWGSALLHTLMLKTRNTFNALIGALIVSALLVAIIVLATLTDPEMPFGLNTIGMVIGLPLGTFMGGMRVINKADAKETPAQ